MNPIRQRVRPWQFIILLFAVTLGACQSNSPMRFYDGDDHSLIYGFIDMGSAPTKMEWANLVQVEPKIDNPQYDFIVNNGVIYATNIPQGRFVLWKFGGTGKFNYSAWSYQFPYKQFKQLRINTGKPGLYYFGAWKYVRTGKDLFKQKTFKLVPSNKINEKELLERILNEDNHPSWKKRIQARIAELS